MAKWTGKTHGTLFGYRIFVWLIGNTSLGISYFFLKIVSRYFFWFSKTSSQYLKDFYTDRLQLSQKESKRLIKENFYYLAQSILDRMAFSMGHGKEITFSNEGESRIVEIANAKKGGILVSAHLSNWDIAGRTLRTVDTKINVVMFDNEHEHIKQYMDEKQGDLKFDVIAQKDDMSHLIKIYQAIKRGELICMHADRHVAGAQTYMVDFFDKPAPFPAGPFHLIHKLKVPYMYVFAAKTDKFHYHFTSTVPKVADEGPAELAQNFVRLLEEKVQQNPEQWFNYHDFYAKQ